MQVGRNAPLYALDNFSDMFAAKKIPLQISVLATACLLRKTTRLTVAEKQS